MFVYLHGFASGPSSSKALFFRERLAETGRELLIPELDGGDFENLTISGQLSIVEDTVRGRDVVLIGSSMGGYLAGLYAATHANVSRMLLLAPAFGFTERWPSSLGETQAAEWKATGRLPDLSLWPSQASVAALRVAGRCREVSGIPRLRATRTDLARASR